MMKTKDQDIELLLSNVIRKNLTIRNLSMMLSDMVSEIGNNENLVAYTGHFQEIQTLLDCILDESNSNDEDLDKTRNLLKQLLTSRKAV